MARTIPAIVPHVSPDPTLVRLMGLDYAADAARREMRLTARQKYSLAHRRYVAANNKLESLDRLYVSINSPLSEVEYMVRRAEQYRILATQLDRMARLRQQFPEHTDSDWRD